MAMVISCRSRMGCDCLQIEIASGLGIAESCRLIACNDSYDCARQCKKSTMKYVIHTKKAEQLAGGSIINGVVSLKTGVKVLNASHHHAQGALAALRYQHWLAQTPLSRATRGIGQQASVVAYLGMCVLTRAAHTRPAGQSHHCHMCGSGQCGSDWHRRHRPGAAAEQSCPFAATSLHRFKR